jgi:putative hemolysin
LDPSYFLYILPFLLFIIASGFFSGTETAFFSLTQVDLTKFREDNSKQARRVVKLMSDSRRLLITILVGNTVVNICAATIATIFVIKLSNDFQFSETLALFIEIVVVTLIILIFSEVMPKLIAVRNASAFTTRISFLIEIIYIIFYPISTALERFTIFSGKLLKVKGEKYFLSEEEIKTLVELGEEQGAIQQEEKEMIDSIFEFGETTVKEIMVPRIDMICLEIKSSIDDLVKIIRDKGHSRIPIYEGRVDHIKGIVHAKDLIPISEIKDKNSELTDLSRQAYFVPESKKIDDLLREFQQEKSHMAIVVDEYGGTAGLVTLEDIIEEIVGEIQDEYDQEQPLYKTINDETYLVDAKITIEELNEILPEPLPQEEGEDFETLGGLIYHITGNVPNINDRVSFYDYDFVVENIDRQRIKKVKIIKTKRNEKNNNFKV